MLKDPQKCKLSTVLPTNMSIHSHMQCRMLVPNTGRLLMAVVLPFRPFVESGTKRTPPKEKLGLNPDANFEVGSPRPCLFVVGKWTWYLDCHLRLWRSVVIINYQLSSINCQLHAPYILVRVRLQYANIVFANWK